MTYTGKRVDPTSLTSGDICIEDIAHALALVNRFGGHTAVPISVAQHSVYVSRLVQGTGCAMQGLLHDASEAYLGDITKWLKESPEFRQYRLLEERAQRVIFRKFGCAEKLAKTVCQADWDLVVFEAQAGYGPATWLGESRANPAVMADWAPWPWARAEREFLDQFSRLDVLGRLSASAGLQAAGGLS